MKIIIADDHSMFRDGVSFLIHKKTQHQVIGEASNAQELLQAVKELKPDLVVSDFRMPSQNTDDSLETLTTISYLKQYYPNLKVILLTGVNSGKLYQEIMASPCDGLVIKESNSNELLEAITAVENGERFISASAQQQIDESSELSQRELEILDQLIKGLNGPSIAKQLNISIKTVENHRTNMMKKLKVSNVIELIHLARKKGYYFS